METPSKSVEQAKEPVVGYVHTTNIPSLLKERKISLLVSTYQAQRFMTLAPNGEKLTMLMRVIPRPTGMALAGDQLAVCSKNQIWIFEHAAQVQDLQGRLLPYDRYYTPRRSYVTGDISAHEIGWHRGELIVVNTRFSCLCKLDGKHSFVPIWRPPFVSACVPEDRCHLNGLVLDGNGPLFVSALGETDMKDGWRTGKASGGCLIHVPSGQVISRGIAMAHSPRVYQGRLWILESGSGSLQIVDAQNGKRTVIAQLPGFLRGLAFHENLAFIGLSKIREKSTFGGMPIEKQVQDLQCAIYIVDINTGQTIGFIQFTKGIEELFDIHVMTGTNNPHVVGFEEDTIDGVYVLP